MQTASTNPDLQRKKVIIIGPAHPLRGGLASFDERLARQFGLDGFDATIYTFSLQYPGFLFPGSSQYSTEPAPEGIDIKVCINSVNPFNWIGVGLEIQKLRPSLVVYRYWLPFMGPCFGTIARLIKKNGYTKIVCIADNVIPHEKRPGDAPFTKYFFKPIDAFVTMSEKVFSDLATFTNKPAKQVVHPMYDNFGEAMPKIEARRHLGLSETDPIILFFGFIRKYKGLDILLEAMNLLKTEAAISTPPNLKLLIAGEYYEERQGNDNYIAEKGLADMLIQRTDFISDSEVKYYLSACDFVIQPYRSATQSGVTPLAYHFEKPMLVTNVGGLPAMMPHGVAGLVAEPTPQSIATTIAELYSMGEDYFMPGLREEKKKYSWSLLRIALCTLVGVEP